MMVVEAAAPLKVSPTRSSRRMKFANFKMEVIYFQAFFSKSNCISAPASAAG